METMTGFSIFQMTKLQMRFSELYFHHVALFGSLWRLTQLFLELALLIIFILFCYEKYLPMPNDHLSYITE